MGGVGVERHGDGGVPQELLDKLGKGVLLEQERGTCVPEVVEGNLEETSSLEERREGSLVAQAT